MKAGLLKRLNNDANGPSDADDLAGAITVQLCDLLNVRMGSCLARPDLGLPAISPVQLQGDQMQSQRLARVIQLQVEHFEPRLQQVKVQSKGEERGLMLFALQASFELRYELWQIELRIQIDNDSRVAVNGITLQRRGNARRL
jgi:type VI secretion system protein